MIQSMTGFAEKSYSSPRLRAKFSLRSLNHRHLDWSCKGTPLGEVENRLRQACRTKLHRGRIEVTVDLDFPDPASWELVINQGLLEKLLDSLEMAMKSLGRQASFTVENLFRIPHVVEVRRKKFTAQEVAFLDRSFKSVLAGLIMSRRQEGRAIAVQVRKHLDAVEKRMKGIGRLSRCWRRDLRAQLKRKRKDLPGAEVLTKERLDGEVFDLVLRSDITEEGQRLESHLAAARRVLQAGNAEPAGRKLDFLAQEIHREVNTINSKSHDVNITQECLAIKEEVEMIRQQVQNLE